MAKKPSLGYGLSRAATIAGWCYLPVYLVGLNVLLGWLTFTVAVQLAIVWAVVARRTHSWYNTGK